jgi:superfamily II DNA or RNA helicase
MAQEKIDRIEEILAEVKERDHLIVYCGDGKLYNDNNEEIRHINFAKEALIKQKYKPSQFTASENMAKRMELVEMFNEGAIDALVAIRCLDEGINIPSITGALILASNDDYREFVQRRGRILRTYGTKQYANIYDVIVLPSVDTEKMALTNDAFFMHCLPVRRNMIVTDDVIESPQSIVIPQAANRVVSAQTVLKEILSGL